MRSNVLLAALAVVLGCPGTLWGATMMIGPVPYRSAADSPFDLSGLGTTFFLEDFEDKLVNSPGPLVEASPSFSNSVDADDGVLDGLGGPPFWDVSSGPIPTNIGWSLLLAPFQCRFGNCSTAFGNSIFFDPSELSLPGGPAVNGSSLPNAVGFVITWKDPVEPGTGVGQGFDEVQVYDQNYEVMATFDISALHSEPLNALDDLFIGVVSDEPISGIAIVREQYRIPSPPAPGSVPLAIIVDHIQYGLVIPEPVSALIVGQALTLLRSRRFQY